MIILIEDSKTETLLAISFKNLRSLSFNSAFPVLFFKLSSFSLILIPPNFSFNELISSFILL
jgi:hypothetical protein